MSARKEKPDDSPGQLYHFNPDVAFTPLGETRPNRQPRPPVNGYVTGWNVLECLDDDRQAVNQYLANALCDPHAKVVKVPVQILARFSALAADLSNHLWRHSSEVMDARLEPEAGE